MKIGEYRLPIWLALCGVMVGLLISVGGPLLFLPALASHPSFAALVIIAALVIEGCWIAVGSIRSKVILYSDAIEVYGSFRMRRLMRNDIVSKTYGGVNIFLWRDRRWQWPFQVDALMNTDKNFKDWMDKVPTGYPSMVRQQKQKEAAQS